MHVMQYEITLPADYDMGIIRNRVATKGHLLDDYPGLGAKAYLIRERGVDDSPVNQYAPFYLWNTPEGMNSFLWGPGFQGIVDDFGRPEVQHWTGLAFAEGSASGEPAKSAVRHRMRIPARTHLGGLATELAEEAGRLAQREGSVYAAAAIDPRTWEALLFSVWDHDSPKGEGDVFQVLHLSAPERGLLPGGRQW
ncbi:DUF4865 family protein [Streptomyces durmitorensis]|uniref:DUF4865 family protein n=1 Tax=Streptomyces durmitorensis TaxID=319947 RepID=A0ABY4Q233_9ACTN|nr:DUF4865 family protein [Streptomyces durmitorensis]UQT60210.1 DUF4865 family protein [Streptomyces durmitorensis]